MKHRASLVLLEQLIMILVFALAAAMCLQIFAKADAMALQTARQDEAVLLAQNAAELLQASADLSVLDAGDYTLQVTPRNSTAGLQQTEISVSLGGEILYTLTVGRQEVSP